MSGCIANTVYGTISGTVATISCAGSGTVVVSQDMATATTTPLAPTNPTEAKDNMAFLGNGKSATLAPVLLAVAPSAANPQQQQLFVLPCEPAAQLDTASGSLGQHIAGGIRGVVSVEPAQNFACIYGAHDVLLIQLDAHQLKIVRNFQCEFEIKTVSASNWSSSKNGEDKNDYVTILVTGSNSKQVAAINYLVSSTSSSRSSAASSNKIRFQTISALVTIPEEALEENSEDSVSCQTLQSTNQSTPGAFVWWACWKSGVVTACHITVPQNLQSPTPSYFGTEAISPCQQIPQLQQEFYVSNGNGLRICASHTTNDIALWSSGQAALLLASAVTDISTSNNKNSEEGNGDGGDSYPQIFARSSQVIRLQTPAAAARCIRGGTFLLIAGLYQNSQSPWTMAIPLSNKLSAHNLVGGTSSTSNKDSPYSSPLELARALLSVDGSQLNNVVAEIESIMNLVEEQLHTFENITEATLNGIEKQLIQLRACRTAFNQREDVERNLMMNSNNNNNSNEVDLVSLRSNSRGREWDRRLHVAFVLLHVTRLFAVATAKSGDDCKVPSISDLCKDRSDKQASFLTIVDEALKIPQDLDEYSQNIQASWPARLVLQQAADHVGLTASSIINEPMVQFQNLIQNSMETIDGSLEWVAFFALYIYGCGKNMPAAAVNNFINALKLPPCLVSLAKMARAVDTRYMTNNDSNTAAEKITIKEASQLANQTTLPVRSLITTLFCSLCDTGNLNAAYCMTSAMTVSTLLRGDKGAFDRSVVLRLAFLAAEKSNLSILAVLLDSVINQSSSQYRGFDDKALVLYVISACARIASNTESIFIFEGKLTDVEDQNCALTQLASFDAHKLKIELLVQLQRHHEALDAAEKFESKSTVEQHWVGVVTSHLRSIVPHQQEDSSEQQQNRLMADGAAALNLFLKNNNNQISNNNNNNDAEVVRPVSSAFYLSRSNFNNNSSQQRQQQQQNVGGGQHQQRCRVFMKKTGMECGSQVPCPYHSASSNHAVALN